MNVLDGQALDERGLYSLEDALRTVPGVEISALGQAMHHLLTQALDAAQFSADAAED